MAKKQDRAPAQDRLVDMPRPTADQNQYLATLWNNGANANLQTVIGGPSRPGRQTA